MKVLLTSFRLAERTASEWFVRDLSRLLHSGGVTVAIFASRLGALAGELRRDGVEVVSHPGLASFRPDLIHAQHSLEAMAALLAHPGVPAVFLSHGGASWREQPPRHPRIRRYLGMTRAIRRWLAMEQRIPQNRVAGLPALVDPAALGEPRRVPPKPATALYCPEDSGSVREETLVGRACTELGIRLESRIGLTGGIPSCPSGLLARYDLVFTSGTAVLQALASGCGVVPVAHGRFGDLVTVDNFQTAAASDFSLLRPPKPDSIQLAELVAELETWDWSRLSPLAARVRELHGEPAVRSRLLDIYDAVLAEAARGAADGREEQPAVGDWMLGWEERQRELDLGYLELQQRASRVQADWHRSGAETEALRRRLELEKEKVRFARRLLQESGVFHQHLKARIEAGWRDIEARHEPERTLPGEPAAKHGVDLSG